MLNHDWQKTKEIFHQTLDLPKSERQSFLAKQDEFIRLQVSRLLNSHEKLNDFIAEPLAVEIGLNVNSYLGKTIGSYKILDSLGTGGMGQVFLAEKIDLDKKFALKIIKRGMDTEAVLKRFVRERRILSRLEHPHIATLFDGGMTADGLPYFVMEYIEGLPLTRFCDEQKLDFKERLELFRQICSAVQYAHQNLIVHRDLKPSNILVTKDGNAKLLDFGIAKLLNSEDFEDTATQARMFTPEYASPEQLNGLPITTASDVYSLGVILYELLSGQRPFQSKSKSYQEIVNQILTEEPVRPSVISNFKFQISNFKSESETSQNIEQRNTNDEQKSNLKFKIRNPKSLRGDLDNIILKSLRKESARRYQSVQEFSEDIRRHLAGLPVSATADSTFYRFSKFVVRHKNAVVLSSLIALVIFSISGIAVWQGFLAVRESERAEKRFEQVRKLANIVLFEYHDGIAKLPGATAMREKMVKDSLEFLDSLSAENDDDLGLLREVVSAYRKVGDIQGSSDTGNVGKTQDSLQSYQKAAAIQEKIVKANPKNFADQIMLGNLNLEIGLQLRGTGDLQTAESRFQNALEIFSKLPDDSEKQSNLAKAFWNIASLKTAQNELDASLENYRKAADLFEKLAINEPENTKHLRNVALTNKNIGSVLQLRGETEDAIECFKKALEIDLKNANDSPNDVSAQLDLSFSYGTLASAFRENENFSDAEINIRKAIEIRGKIFSADAKNSFAENALATGFQDLGKLYIDKKGFLKAVAELVKAQEIYQRMTDADAENVDKRARLAQNLALQGKVFGLNKNLTNSIKSFSNSAKIFENLLGEGKLSTIYQSRFAASILDYAEILLNSEQPENALEQIKKAEELLTKIPVSVDLNKQKARVFELRADASLAAQVSSVTAQSNSKSLYQQALTALNDDLMRFKNDKQLVRSLARIRQKMSKLQN